MWNVNTGNGGRAVGQTVDPPLPLSFIPTFSIFISGVDHFIAPSILFLFACFFVFFFN